MKTKIKFAVLTAAFAAFAAICGILSGCLFNTDFESMYNDDAQILKNSSITYSVGMQEFSFINSYSMSCQKFSGIDTIDTITIDPTDSAEVELEIESGKLKIVLTGNNTVYMLLDSETYTGETSISYENIPAGRYSLKIVAVSAKVTNLYIDY